jgi:outer membrane biosynthesis protein TonB
VVILDALVDEQGNVVEAKIVSGRPLLVQSAQQAVKSWKL